MAMHFHVSVFAVSYLLRRTANLTLNLDESYLTSDKTQMYTMNDTHFEMCSSQVNVCSYFIEWDVLVFWSKYHHVLKWSHFPHNKRKQKPWHATHQLFKECFKILALFSKTASHPFPNLERGADNSASHNGTKVFSYHPPMDFSYQDLQC